MLLLQSTDLWQEKKLENYEFPKKSQIPLLCWCLWNNLAEEEVQEAWKYPATFLYWQYTEYCKYLAVNSMLRFLSIRL